MDEMITREALNRLEANASDRLASVKELIETQLTEIRRRLSDLNNSHEKAAEEKRRTDEAALKVQENAVTKEEVSRRFDEVNRRLDLQQGAAAATAKAWSVVMALLAIVASVVIRVLTQ